ncbi:MAG: signal recognition particle-docking protein FtsY [Lentisphaeria bacterium]|nr:signal recognition particle-docking protein FtsY [Lentisphaeria bacterium]
MPSILRVFQHGLQKTKTALVRRLQSAFAGSRTWDAQTYEALEEALLSTDLGVDVSLAIVGDIRDRYNRGLLATTADILDVARSRVTEILRADGDQPVALNPDGPTVVLMVGVNGSGKTTTAAKLAAMVRRDGRNVILAAGDTFRAAGIEQLQIWGQRVGCPVIAGRMGGDAAAVAFDAVNAARQRGADFLIIDTAGRQHTRKVLMEELAKMRRSIEKAMPGAPHEVWLTVDASTGSNALVQAREFGRLFPISGLILTKLDGSGKGGVVVAIRHELGYPVRFVGLGEGLEDLQPFDVEVFAEALFA